uniref:RING-type E3 ubiquitin transferase n=1 Tax=Parastrongyloides trichosuri TaxID=131310 RepID=A0A0N4ZUC3_PARTI
MGAKQSVQSSIESRQRSNSVIDNSGTSSRRRESSTEHNSRTHRRRFESNGEEFVITEGSSNVGTNMHLGFPLFFFSDGPSQSRRRGNGNHDAIRIVRSQSQCPVCKKVISNHELPAHLNECLKPRLQYNDEVLTQDRGECPICLEEMEKGSTIARLECFCIFHKQCIDTWLCRGNSNWCPEHPVYD